MTVDDAIESLEQNKRSMSRSQLEALLVEFGFIVRAGTKGNHRTFTHPGLAAARFYGGRFDGGHGKDSEVLICYVLDVRNIFKKYRSELQALRGETNA